MLNDSRSDALVDGFLGSWLGLRELGATPPDRGDFRDFYHYDLDTAMRRETFLFTRHLLNENLGVVHFLDSNFTFVNKPLARLYGLEPPAGHQFEKVSLQSRRRGGLLGQSSVLTLTANGIDTSSRDSRRLVVGEPAGYTTLAATARCRTFGPRYARRDHDSRAARQAPQRRFL